MNIESYNKSYWKSLRRDNIHLFFSSEGPWAPIPFFLEEVCRRLFFFFFHSRGIHILRSFTGSFAYKVINFLFVLFIVNSLIVVQPILKLSSCLMNLLKFKRRNHSENFNANTHPSFFELSNSVLSGTITSALINNVYFLKQ